MFYNYLFLTVVYQNVLSVWITFTYKNIYFSNLNNLFITIYIVSTYLKKLYSFNPQIQYNEIEPNDNVEFLR